MGDDGIMIWRGIGYHGEFEIKFIIRKLNCEICIGTIDEQINAYANEMFLCFSRNVPSL